MRKIFLGVAAISLLFGALSCQKEVVEKVTDGKNNIQFHGVLGKSTVTKATEFRYWEAGTPGQKIDIHSYALTETTEWHLFQPEYGAAFGKPGYTAVNAQWDHNDWWYGADIEQPGYVLRYYSVYPTTNVVNAVATSDSYKFDYTVRATSATQEDLIGATRSTILNIVSLNFNHLLSQVNFAVQGMEDVEIKISNIKVNGVKNSGTYTFSTWGTPTVDGNVSNIYDYSPIGTAETLLAAGTENTVIHLGNKGGNDPLDNANNNALMLMPQTFSAEADGTFSFNFSLTVSTKGIKPDGSGVFDDPRAVDVPVVVNFSDFETTTWKPGKRYLYVIDFTPYLAGGKIRFNVEVADWEDDEDITTAETIQVANPTKVSLEAAIDRHSLANKATTALTIFPISIPEAIATPIVINKLYGFDTGDVIRIECLTAAEALKITLDPVATAGWARTVEDGRVVVLTCTTPTLKGASIHAATGDVAGIEAAIAALTVTPATVVTEYFIEVGEVAAAAQIANIANSATYASGDRIRIVCANVASATNVTLAPAITGWTRDVLSSGIDVIFVKQ